VALASADVAAHRVDEYLQAARISVDRDRVQVTLDLTPGLDIAPRVVADIDRNRDGSVDTGEGTTYAARVQRDLRLEVDGRPVMLGQLRQQYPSVAAMLNGEGTIELRWTSILPALAPGEHRLSYRNLHRPDISAYLANALVPTSDVVTVVAQHRDIDQRELVIEYRLRDRGNTPMR
jgi:hypothetical protein